MLDLGKRNSLRFVDSLRTLFCRLAEQEIGELGSVADEVVGTDSVKPVGQKSDPAVLLSLKDSSWTYHVIVIETNT